MGTREVAGDGLFHRWMRGRREDLAVATKAEVRGGPQAHNCAFGRIRSFFLSFLGNFNSFCVLVWARQV